MNDWKRLVSFRILKAMRITSAISAGAYGCIFLIAQASREEG